MRVRRLSLQHFRGVSKGTVLLDGHSLLVGSNSVGKSTVCEALELILGPERMFRRPVIDEYDFYGARYQPVEGELPEIRLEAVLTDLSPEAERNFGPHLRRWSPESNDFADLEPGVLAEADAGEWCLPVVFLGRFDPQEDDFFGGTYFGHPESVPDDLTEESAELGAGLRPFTREDKRYCGFLYLRPNRTGSRALTFQRGSLLDTIVRLEAERAGPLWEKALTDLSAVVLAGEDSGFAKIRSEVTHRVDRFVSLAGGSDPVDLQVSEQTREHLREVLRLFIATQPGTHAVPFNRLSTGTLNLLVFALLTYIAELKGDHSVIFAMEEPEIALPPHAQRRLVDFVTQRMGQTIVTSHSPYVIEKFDPGRIVVLGRNDTGELASSPVVLPAGFKAKRYRDNRRQFAEAVLARAVLVVEGTTEADLIPAVADVLDQDPAVDYLHPDFAGVTVFNAQNDVSVPLYAPVFKSLGKPVYGIHDTPTQPLAPDVAAKTNDFTRYEVIPYKGIEDLLTQEIPVSVQRRFLTAAAGRADYPGSCGYLQDGMDDIAVRALTGQILKVRKGDGYAAALVAECRSQAELPASIANFLLQIDSDVRPQADDSPAPSAAETDDDAADGA
ncbi:MULTISPECIES: AAA family ATPase [unclassified Streptomyces]|uniref:ATP-dependent nuclease n=1 Tax=unclassified Streptomyces TaxID=2593676 RepID=UPI0018D76037|nr:AAA family ATPase [Streptomyces sp. HB-N217]MBH5129509.1 AAA family ATPase [Streptomyces sp. HB-N217]